MMFRHSRESGNPIFFSGELASRIFKWIPAFGAVEKARFVPDRRGNSPWLPCIYANI